MVLALQKKLTPSPADFSNIMIYHIMGGEGSKWLDFAFIYMGIHFIYKDISKAKNLHDLSKYFYEVVLKLNFHNLN